MVDYTFMQPRLQMGDRSQRDGGAAYVSRLIDALRAAGHRVTITGGTAVPTDGVVMIDGLDLACFPPEALDGAAGLFHQVVPLADGAAAARLRRVVAASEAAAARLMGEFAVPAERVTVVQPGVSDAARSTGSGGPHCEILSIGALVPRKGHAVLIDALSKLVDLDWRLTIVGDATRDPATAATLGALAERSGGRVHLAGSVDEADLEALWRQADLFALATEWEGYAAAVAEALRRGVPVAVTAGGAAGTLVTPGAGVVCEVGDGTQLSKSLRRLIYDTELRAAMAEAAWRAGRSLPDWTLQAERFVAATT